MHLWEAIFMKKSVVKSYDDMEATATRVSMVSIIGNTVLALFKLAAGIIANSGAMISDAVHSASDIISSIIVIIGVKLSARASDNNHPYGHERFECVAAIVLSVILFVVGIFIGKSAIDGIFQNESSNLNVPGMLALIAAIISIVSKEAMFRYTKHYAKMWSSSALMADAWHHRSDAFSSIGALIGIVGARIGFPILDPVASLIICLFIIKASYDIFKDAINKMIDRSCSEATERDIIDCAAKQNGVLKIDSIKTRIFGNRIYVDIEICADGKLTLEEGHEIAENVHTAIEQNFENVKHIMVHVNPYTDENCKN